MPTRLETRATAPPRLAGVFTRLRSHPNLWAAGLYVLASLIIERAAVAHINSVCACNAGAEPTQYMWAMVWWPHALLDGLNPFVTHQIWAPAGISLGSATSVPGLALLAWPFTATLGPLVTFNLLSLLAPVLSAWFAYRLCLYVTKQPAAAIVGGYLFGFSSYELAHLVGLLHTVFVFPAPLVVLLTLKRLDEAITRRRYAVQLAGCLVFELLVSTEILLTLTLFGAGTLLLAFILGSRSQRNRIVMLLPPIGGAYVVTAIICSPFLYYALRFNNAYSAGWSGVYSADLLSFVIPTEITRIGSQTFASVAAAYTGNPTENGAYLGLPLLCGSLAFAVTAWRTRMAKLLSGCLIMGVIWSLGPHLWVDGQVTIPMPWALFDKLPLLSQLLPVRVVVYVALAAAVMFAAWLAQPRRTRVWRWTVAALSVAFLWPNLSAVYPHTTISLFNGRYAQPRFFTTDLYRKYLRRNEVVLPIPFGRTGPSLLWQAWTGMWFRMASGHFYIPASYADQPAVTQLLAGAPSGNATMMLRWFMVTHHVGAIIAAPGSDLLWRPVFKRLGFQPVTTGGVVIYRVSQRA
jgi:hypothetical protein